jgi:hypothetical protein
MLPSPGTDRRGMQNHYLDRLVWDAETWVAEFNNLLDALELQFSIEDELAAEIASLENSGNED